MQNGMAVNSFTREQQESRSGEAEGWYRSLFEDNHAIMLLIDPVDGSIVDVNNAAEAFYGWPKEQMRGMRIQDINTLDEAQVQCLIQKASHESQRVFHFYHRRRDASVHRVEVYTGPIKIAQRTLLYSIVHDVEHYRAHEQLRVASMDALVASSEDIIVVKDLDLRIVATNQSFAHLVGCEDVQDLIGRDLHELLRANGYYALAERCQKNDQRARRLDKGESLTNEAVFPVPGKGERVFFERIFPIFRQDGERLGIGVVAVDVTEQKQAAERLRKSEARYRTLAENFPDGALFLLDRDLRYLAATGQALPTVGIDSARVIGLTVSETFPQLADEVSPALRAALHGEEVSFDVQFRGRDWACRALPIQHDGPKIEQILVLAQDNTERKQTEEARAQALQEMQTAKNMAEAANRAKSAFIAMMSHELRTPLNPILGLTDVLIEDTTEEDTLECLRMIQRSGQDLLALIEDILDMSKLHAHALEARPREFSLRDIVEGEIGGVLSTAQEKGLRLELSIAADVPELIVSDPQRICQILRNLLNNAIKFTAQGEIYLRIETDGEFIRIHVRDTGIGIDPGKQATIFEPFAQANSSITRRYGGTGLGLSIARNLAELLHGGLTVRSQPGSGSEFTLSIPQVLQTASTPAVMLDEPGQEQEQAALAILVVEDDPASQATIRAQLHSLGHHADVVADGKTAMERAATRHYDAIFLDLQLPGEDGRTICRNLRATLPPEAQPRIIAQTAHALPRDRRSCLEAGMDECLTKPLRRETLAKALRGL